jgi:hypothetical protein
MIDDVTDRDAVVQAIKEMNGGAGVILQNASGRVSKRLVRRSVS